MADEDKSRYFWDFVKLLWDFIPTSAVQLEKKKKNTSEIAQCVQRERFRLSLTPRCQLHLRVTGSIYNRVSTKRPSAFFFIRCASRVLVVVLCCETMCHQERQSSFHEAETCYLAQ